MLNVIIECVSLRLDSNVYLAGLKFSSVAN